MWANTLLRRNAILTFVAFVAYFCAAVLPMLLFRTSPADVQDYISSTISGEMSFTSFVTVLHAVCLSVMTFDYLHSSASCSEFHSFPLTRGKLFRTSVAVECVLAIIPVILTGIGICAAGSMVQVTSSYNVAAITTPLNCLKWVIDTAVGSVFVLAISNLAGIIAGKTIIHVLLAYFLNSIVGITCLLMDGYANSFVFGSAGFSLSWLSNYSSPFIWYMAGRGGMLTLKDVPIMLMFIGIAVLITLFTGFLYKIVKLEREQNATVFPVVSDFLVIYLTFCTMSAFGFMLAAMQQGTYTTIPVGPFLIGCLFTGPVSFIVYRMIAESSVRIFNARALMNFIVLLLISAVVFAFTCFDITHQAAKVPDPSDVKRVSIRTMEPFDTTITLSEADSIKNVIALHEAVVSHKDDFATSDDKELYHLGYTMDYVLSDGSTLTRQYEIDTGKNFDDIKDAVNTLSKGDEYNEKLDHYMRKLIITNKGVELCPQCEDTVKVEKDDIRPLLMAYLKDHKKNGSEYYTSLYNQGTYAPTFTKDSFAIISVNLKPADPLLENYMDTATFAFGQEDTHVLKFLEKHGYTDKMIEAEGVSVSDVEEPDEVTVEE